jgi:hypothetical protein
MFLYAIGEFPPESITPQGSVSKRALIDFAESACGALGFDWPPRVTTQLALAIQVHLHGQFLSDFPDTTWPVRALQIGRRQVHKHPITGFARKAV